MNQEPWLFGEPLGDGWKSAGIKNSDLVEGKGQFLDFNGRILAVFLHENHLVILDGHCPHAGAPLSRGWIEEGLLICPLHRWKFRISTGECLTSPRKPIQRYLAQVAGDGTIWVKIEDQSAPFDSCGSDPFGEGSI